MYIYIDSVHIYIYMYLCIYEYILYAIHHWVNVLYISPGPLTENGSYLFWICKQIVPSPWIQIWKSAKSLDSKDSPAESHVVDSNNFFCVESSWIQEARERWILNSPGFTHFEHFVNGAMARENSWRCNSSPKNATWYLSNHNDVLIFVENSSSQTRIYELGMHQRSYIPQQPLGLKSPTVPSPYTQIYRTHVFPHTCHTYAPKSNGLSSFSPWT